MEAQLEAAAEVEEMAQEATEAGAAALSMAGLVAEPGVARAGSEMAMLVRVRPAAALALVALPAVAASP